MTIAEIEERRAKRKANTAKARESQYEKDLECVDKLEEEHGPDRVGVLQMPSYVPGLPTLVVVRTPSSAVFNRFRSMVRKAGQKMVEVGAAKDLMAASCVAYPEEEIYARMREEWPSIHDNVGIEAIRLGESEGKE